MRYLMNCLIMGLLLCLAAPASAELDPAAALPLDPAYRTGQLDNGLTWYVRRNDEPHNRAFLNLVVKVGSLQEDDDQRGLAHFLEHMAFNGTANFEKQELINYLETIGMEFGPEINAYTSFDETVYMLAIPTDDPEYLEQGLRILADWSRRISLDPDEVVRERGVVLDEWRGRLGAGQRIQDLESGLTYAGSRYAERLPIGDPEIIGNAEAAPIRRFYEQWYRPELMAVVAVGDFDEEHILDLIHQNFDEQWGPDQPRELLVSDVVPHETTLWGLFEDPEFTRSSVRIQLKFEESPPRTLGDYREAVQTSLVRGLFSARVRELIDRNVATFTGVGLGSGQLSPGWVAWTLSTRAADGELAPALEQALTEWRRVQEHGFTQTELDRRKTDILRADEARWKDRENQDSSNLARRMTSVFLGRSTVTGPEWTLQTDRELLPTIELADLAPVIAELDFGREDSRVVLVNAPQRAGLQLPSEPELEGAMAAAAVATVQPWVDTVSDSPLVADPPEPGEVVAESVDTDLGLTTWTLSNGIRVLIKPTDFNEDRFSFQAFSPGGTSLGSTGPAPAEDFAATIVASGGVGEFDAPALRKALTGKLAGAQAWIGTYEEGFSGGGSPDDLETALQLVWLYALHPRRDEAAFASLIDRFSTMIENRSLDPDQVYSDSMSVILYDHDPRAEPLTPEDLAAIKLDDSFRFYRDRFADLDDLVLVLVGDLDLATLRPLVEEYIATLPATDRVETWRDNGMRWVDGPLHRVIETGVDDKARTTLMLHGPAEWSRKNRFGMSALASGLEIRLREVLREDLGGTYGVSVSGSVDAWPEPEWSLTISFGCEPARLDELVDEATALLDKVHDEGLPPEVFQKVIEQVLRTNEESVRTNGYWTSVLAYRARHGIDQREELDTRTFIESFTPEDLQAVAQRTLDTGRLIRLDKVPEAGS